jgi:hypothetical protein
VNALTLLKALLVVFLVIGLTVLLVRGFRRSQSNRGDFRWSRRPDGPPGHTASVYGNLPSTPLPEWVDWTDTETGGEDAEGRDQFGQ